MNSLASSLKLSCLASTVVFVSIYSSMVQAKEYYKWVDQNGSTHYTTTPPPKSAKKKGKVETYGWKAPTTSVNTNTNQSEAPQTSQTQTIPTQQQTNGASNTESQNTNAAPLSETQVSNE